MEKDHQTGCSKRNLNDRFFTTVSSRELSTIYHLRLAIVEHEGEGSMSFRFLASLGKFDLIARHSKQTHFSGSILSFSHPIGALISGFLQERFGRRGSMILVNIPTLAAWTTLHLADSIYQLYIVAATMGLSIGFLEAPLHSYIGEVGEPHFRGTMSTMGTAAALLGVLTIHMLGYLVRWRTAALISAAVPLITIVCLTRVRIEAW